LSERASNGLSPSPGAVLKNFLFWGSILKQAEIFRDSLAPTLSFNITIIQHFITENTSIRLEALSL
jgi:hypothetical protein